MSAVACDFLERKSSSFNEKEALLLNLYDVLRSSCTKNQDRGSASLYRIKIRIQLCTLMRIRIQLFTLMRIRILFLINLIGMHHP
jgi:hypothetical protein